MHHNATALPLLIIFAKAPVPGTVKTRLQTNCKATVAAQIYTVMLECTVASAHRHWPGPVQLCCWPHVRHSTLDKLAARYDVPLTVQRGDDLGERMYIALRDAVTSRGSAAIIGSDTPQISCDILQQAYKALSARRNVLGPAMDGGFYLIGSCQAPRQMLTGLSWGHNKVLHDTLERCREAGIIFTERLPRLCDVDDWDSLVRVARSVPQLRPFINNGT